MPACTLAVPAASLAGAMTASIDFTLVQIFILNSSTHQQVKKKTLFTTENNTLSLGVGTYMLQFITSIAIIITKNFHYKTHAIRKIITIYYIVKNISK